MEGVSALGRVCSRKRTLCAFAGNPVQNPDNQDAELAPVRIVQYALNPGTTVARRLTAVPGNEIADSRQTPIPFYPNLSQIGALCLVYNHLPACIASTINRLTEAPKGWLAVST